MSKGLPAILSVAAVAAVERYQAALEARARAEEAQRQVREEIERLLRGAPWGVLPNGYRVGFREQSISGHFVQPRTQRCLFIISEQEAAACERALRSQGSSNFGP